MAIFWVWEEREMSWVTHRFLGGWLVEMRMLSSLRAEESWGEGDEFSLGQSVHFLAFTTKWKGRLANVILSQLHRCSLDVKLRNMLD